MDEQEAKAFAERVREAGQFCRYGHVGCSDLEGGACIDEEFSLLGLNNDGERT